MSDLEDITDDLAEYLAQGGKVDFEKLKRNALAKKEDAKARLDNDNYCRDSMNSCDEPDATIVDYYHGNAGRMWRGTWELHKDSNVIVHEWGQKIFVQGISAEWDEYGDWSIENFANDWDGYYDEAITNPVSIVDTRQRLACPVLYKPCDRLIYAKQLTVCDACGKIYIKESSGDFDPRDRIKEMERKLGIRTCGIYGGHKREEWIYKNGATLFESLLALQRRPRFRRGNCFDDRGQSNLDSCCKMQSVDDYMEISAKLDRLIYRREVDPVSRIIHGDHSRSEYLGLRAWRYEYGISKRTKDKARPLTKRDELFFSTAFAVSKIKTQHHESTNNKH